MSNTIDSGVINKFNRGEVSREAFAREDIARVENSCESMVDWLPERLGTMTFRPGTELLPIAVDENTLLVEFVTSVDDPILIVMQAPAGTPTMSFMRNDAIVTRPSVTTDFENQSFTGAFATGEWVDADEVGDVTSVISGGSLTLTGDGTNSAITYQTTTVTETGVLHAFKIRVDFGTILCQIGTGGVSSGDLFERELGVGEHYLNFTPSTHFTITLSSDKRYESVVGECELNDTGSSVPISIDVPASISMTWNLDAGSTGLSEIRSLRHDVSGNQIYFASKFFTPFLVTRLGDTSFSIERYVTDFGPYEDINTTSISMITGAITGNSSLTASRSYFNSPGSRFGFAEDTLFKMAVTGQLKLSTDITLNAVTGSVLVFGVGAVRVLNVQVLGNASTGVYLLEKSFDEITWQVAKTYPEAGAIYDNYNDGLDGADIYYRLKISTLHSSSPSATHTMTLRYEYGVIESEARIQEKVSDTQVNVQWRIPVEITQASKDWYIGSWGGKNDYPSTLAFYESRLWFAGGSKIWGSETDNYTSFDRNITGASASIQKTIGFGSSQEIFWLAPSARLVAGTALSEIDIRSNTFGEVLTALNTNLKKGSNRGCSNVPPLSLDQEIIFVQRGGDKLMSIDFNISQEKHNIEDFNLLNDEILAAGVVKMVATRNPETRIYVVLADGTMRVLLRDKNEDVLGWSTLNVKTWETSNLANVIDVVVIPGDREDSVYIVTAGATTGKILKFASISDASTKYFDAHTNHTSPGTTISLTSYYVVGSTVGVVVDGVDDGDYVVASGPQITGVTSGTNVTVGYRYTPSYKSNKLGSYSSASGLNRSKRILNTGLIAKDFLLGGIQVGPDASSLKDLTFVENGSTALEKTDYDFLPFDYDGESVTDPRIHIAATRPCTIMAITYEMKDTDRPTRGK